MNTPNPSPPEPSKGMLPKIKHGKNPIVGFILGFLFGPFGVGLYLQSWVDFFICLGVVFFGAVFTVGIGAPVFWMICGGWAAFRVQSSRTG